MRTVVDRHLDNEVTVTEVERYLSREKIYVTFDYEERPFILVMVGHGKNERWAFVDPIDKCWHSDSHPTARKAIECAMQTGTVLEFESLMELAQYID